MAYLEARAGIARAGVTYAGLCYPHTQFTVGGAVIQPHVGELAVSMPLDGIGSCDFQVRDSETTPEVYEEVRLLRALPNTPLFGGHIMDRSIQVQQGQTGAAVWQCEAVDYRWLLDRYALVTAVFRNRGVGTIVGTILADSTDGGFRLGECPQSLGNITEIRFTNETVSRALERVAAHVGATLLVTPEKRVSIRVNHNDGNALAFGASSTDIRGPLRYSENGTQVRNKTIGEGGTVQTTAAAAAGASTIALNETGWLDSTGGELRHEDDIITYTGQSTAAGAGDATGVTGVDGDIPIQAALKVRETAEDAAAQAVIAGLLGGGLSGVITHYLQDGRLDADAIADRVTQDVAKFGALFKEVSYETTSFHHEPGKTVAVSLSGFFVPIDGTFLVQSVEIVPHGTFYGSNGSNVLRFTVSTSVYRWALASVLARLLTS